MALDGSDGENGKIGRRRSIQLQGCDLSQARAYFVTICVEQRLSLFGAVVEECMTLSSAGEMVQQIWDEIPRFILALIQMLLLSCRITSTES